jgi:hypothetical protein
LIEFLDDVAETSHPLPQATVRKGFYYRALGGNRLYFSDNEIKDVLPRFGYYLIVLHNGGQYQVRSSVPDEVCFEMPHRESVKGDYFFVRS